MGSVQQSAGPSSRLIQKQPIRLKRPRNLQGSTRHFKVYVDPRLGPDGQKDANFVLARCEDDYTRISSYFGGLAAGPFNVILFTHPSGAYHNTCAATDLFCDAPIKPARGRYSELLNIMEFVEVFEAVQDKGWDCGTSSGEGLSRVLATDIYPGELDGFATANDWLKSSRRNYVDHNSQTDASYPATGCAVLFLNWLHHQLGFSWLRIVAAGAPTLGQTYATLTGNTDGYIRFKALIESHYPRRRKSSLKTDNPFPL